MASAAQAAPVDVGVLVASAGPPEPVLGLAHEACLRAQDVLEAATGRPWRFHDLPPLRHEKRSARRPSEFLDEAALRMVEGPYDMMLVWTDGPLVSRSHAPAGLASAAAHTVVVSAWKLQMGPRDRPVRELDEPPVVANAAALVLHLVGHVLGARGKEGAMAPWRFAPKRTALEGFTDADRSSMQAQVAALGAEPGETESRSRLAWFHVRAALRRPRDVWRPVLRSRAPLLALRLPRLSTAAVVPLLVLVFTAEIWDVGVNMHDGTALAFAALAVVSAAVYTLLVTDLVFPRKERKQMTEHLAVVNVAIVLIVFLAMLGLLALLWILSMAIALWLFPEGLIRTWPTLGGPDVDLVDRMRLALFVASVGTLTGALGAGLESRTVLRHLALFREEV